MTLKEAGKIVDEVTEFIFDAWMEKKFNVKKARKLAPEMGELAKVLVEEKMMDMALICLGMRDLLSQLKKDDILVDASGEAYWLIPDDCELALVTLGSENDI